MTDLLDMKNSIDRRAFLGIGYGMYIVASERDGKLNGQIANTVFQVSSEPALIATAISKDNLTHDYIEKSGHFSITILEQSTPFQFIGLFGFRSGRDVDKFSGVKHKIAGNGCPIIIENAVSAIELKTVNQVDVGSHSLFIGEVLNTEIFSEGSPLTYAYYREYIKGKTPKASPTFIPPEQT